MEIEQYAAIHHFIYISVKDIKRLCAPILPFTGMGKSLLIRMPGTIWTEVQEICKQEAFDYLLMSTKAGMTYDSTAMHWIAETEDAFAWFAMNKSENIKTSLRIIAQPGTLQLS